jgi:hypothetical protein
MPSVLPEAFLKMMTSDNNSFKKQLLLMSEKACAIFSLSFLDIAHRPNLLRIAEDREELDKLLQTNDMISMHLLSIEFDSELLFMSACSIWLHSVTRLEYAIDSDLFCV